MNWFLIQCGLKTLLHQGLSEPEFYGDLVYKFKIIVSRADFSDQFRKIIICYKRTGYNINIMRQSACLVVNPITVNNFRKLPSIYVFSYFPFGFEGRMWDLILSVPDHCLSFYFASLFNCTPVGRQTQ